VSRRYVVKVARGYHGPDFSDEYLAALQHNPYQKAEIRPHLTSSEQGDAFVFRSRSAAEVAAVYVCGRVVRLKRKDTEAHSRLTRIKRNAYRLAQLRRLCGYVEDGSNTVVTISQDDATRTWCVRTGHALGTQRDYYGDTFEAAIDAAAKSRVNDNEGER
jgi:hypothetical protein